MAVFLLCGLIPSGWVSFTQLHYYVYNFITLSTQRNDIKTRCTAQQPCLIHAKRKKKEITARMEYADRNLERCWS